jgi:hypothetical protein
MGQAACMGQKKHAYKIVAGKPLGNKPPDDVYIHASRCEDIKTDLKPFVTQHYTVFTRTQDKVFPLSLVFKYARSS